MRYPLEDKKEISNYDLLKQQDAFKKQIPSNDLKDRVAVLELEISLLKKQIKSLLKKRD